MKYNFYILIKNNGNSYKFYNSSYDDYNNNNDITKFLFIKIIFILLFFATINHNSEISLKSNTKKTVENRINYNNNTKEFIIDQNNSIFWNFTLVKNEMDYFSLFNQFKIPQFSFILMDNLNNKINLIDIINNIKCLLSQNFSFLQIILHRQNMKRNEYKNIYKQFKELIQDNTIKIYVKSDKINETYISLINSSEGLYTIFINDSSILNKIELQKIYEYKISKLDNILYYNISENSNIYLLKTKILKDFIDKGNEVNTFYDILTNISQISLNEFNYIHISLCLDNRYSKLAYVTMISILSSKNINTYICFYLIIPENFKKNNINFLESIHEQYEDFNLTFINMDNRYENAYTDRRITTQAYYRFSLANLLPNINKIIYFDTDIIVYKDLSNFYNLNFEGKMILGQATYGNKKAQKLGYHRINTGVLLLNLKAMREINFEDKVIEIIKQGLILKYHDQTLINDYFNSYLGIFPPEYHTRPWSNFREMKTFISRAGVPFNKDYFYFANKYPYVRHFLGSYKPKNPLINFIEDWWFFARKSKYYNESSRNFESAFSY